MIYSLDRTLTQRVLMGLDSLKYRNEKPQIFLDRRNLVRSIFNRLPEPVEFNTGFSELDSEGYGSQTCLQIN